MPISESGLWYPELFDKQLPVFNSKARALCVSGPRKSGKCTSAETIVQSGDHLVRMARFGPPAKAGEYVLCTCPVTAFDRISYSVVPARTSGFYHDSATEALKITVHGGYQIVVSPVHPLWSLSGHEDYRQSCEIAALVAAGQPVLLPIYVGFDNWSGIAYKKITLLPHDRVKIKRHARNRRIREAIAAIPSGRKHDIATMAGTTYATVGAFMDKPNDVFPIEVEMDEHLAYLIGVLIGDGCMTPGAAIAKKRILLATDDEEILRSCTVALAKHFKSARLEHLKGCNYQLLCPWLRAMIVSLGINTYAHEKVLPDVLIESPKSVVRALLQGLFDTDGTSDRKGRVSFCSTSERLARDVQQLLLAFGLISALRCKKTTGRLAYLVELYGDSKAFYELIGFRLERKQKRKEFLPKTSYGRHNDACDTMGGRLVWRQVVSCVHCKADLYDTSVPIYHSFLGNGFINHNTWAVLHKVTRHMWETPGARVAMFSRTMKNAKEAGTWADLHTITIPEWINADIGLQYTTVSAEGIPGPKVDGQTRTPRFKIRNAWGGESECMLFSLDFDGDIEDKIKSQRFSMIYFSELSNFRDRKILSVSLPQLRMPHLKMDDQMWIADTNPSEEGDSSWIYEVFYIERTMEYEKYVERNKERGRPVMPEAAFLNFQRGLQLVEIHPEQNPYLDPRELEELKSTYAYDEGLYARYVLGKWVYGDGDLSRHFRTAFLQAHLVGDCEASDEAEWIYALPHPNAFELVTGWDLGDRNHAAVVLDKVMIEGRSTFVILDELESIGEDVSNEAFTESFMELIARIEETDGKKYELERNWSDRSSIERYSATGDTFPYLQVYAASEERIFLKGVPKGRGSVRTRVQLIKQLLKNKRLFVSAHCKAIRRMFKELKKGATEVNYVVPDENKHIFDALSYPILMECAEELENVPKGGVNEGRKPLLIQIS